MQKKQKAVYRLSLLKKSKETNEEMQVEKDLRMIIEDEWDPIKMDEYKEIAFRPAISVRTSTTFMQKKDISTINLPS